MQVKAYREIKLKSGEVIPQGTLLEIKPSDSNSACIANWNGKELKLRYSAVKKAPSLRTIQRWVIFDCVAKSIAGKRVEPDGHDEFGFPAWSLALGVI